MLATYSPCVGAATFGPKLKSHHEPSVWKLGDPHFTEELAPGVTRTQPVFHTREDPVVMFVFVGFLRLRQHRNNHNSDHPDNERLSDISFQRWRHCVARLLMSCRAASNENKISHR